MGVVRDVCARGKYYKHEVHPRIATETLDLKGDFHGFSQITLSRPSIHSSE